MDKYLNLARDIVLANIEKEQYAVFLFGSRAADRGGSKADIDIGILGRHVLDDYKMRQLSEALENSIIPYPVDIVDFNRVDAKFKQHALRVIQIWNKPQHIALN